ncbi:ATP-binding cassette domain-containing protein [Oceanomicrobium pacificus]|uniref:ATP-binding cassette domain-containing protein n=1 Tax=Oceanomicrobium pacificus TaxID=2692916 RepID=A0A6B0TYJ2_9RHOB|nr:metal ABC transporter ATP-binding protein [Oceanomicrobium pacificus]MXU66765.1 ATP-binding cassette domain-containing protein [Oceanomicrobium pacificus]
MSLIDARNVIVRLGDAEVLTDIDFRIDRGEIVTIVGPNGSGKSTLLRVLIGAEAPHSGTVERERGLRIGYVPQRLAVDRTLPLTVGRFLRLSGGTAERRADMLARVGASGLGDRQLGALSGGQFQRVMLAQALLVGPDILVLDEPTQGLDQPGEAALYRLIEDVHAEIGCAVLMVSHDLHVVMSASDRVICLNGHICCEGTPTVVSEAPEYRALFGLGTEGALALYRHEHSHHHHHDHPHDAAHDHAHDHHGSDADRTGAA